MRLPDIQAEPHVLAEEPLRLEVPIGDANDGIDRDYETYP